MSTKKPKPEASSGILSHVDERGHVRMVDVGSKPPTRRRAVAGGRLHMKQETLRMIATAKAPKGDVLATARIAGIMAAKRCADLIPMCHPVSLTHVSVDLEPSTKGSAFVDITAVCETVGQTGVEMEALTAASVAGLALYDMCKAVDRGMVLDEIMLLEKEGGASGRWSRER